MNMWKQIQPPVRTLSLLFLACRPMLSPCVLAWPSSPHVCVGRWVGEWGSLVCLLRRTLSYQIRAPPSWPYLTLITSFEAPSPNIQPTLGVGVSMYEIWRNTNIQSVTIWKPQLVSELLWRLIALLNLISWSHTDIYIVNINTHAQIRLLNRFFLSPPPGYFLGICPLSVDHRVSRQRPKY